MTSLSHQLRRLALPQSDQSLLTRRNVASLLFDPKDAAAMDRNTFYALGCTGLDELQGVDSSFSSFHQTLFSVSSQTLERSVQSKEVNLKLDEDISLFLTRLSPYFLLKPAHKCMEWLIHRFHIHLYNVDSLLACVFPFHDTNMFVRVVQLLRIKDATNRWNWLQCLQKPGVPLSKAALITHCLCDLGFMDFICSGVSRSIQAFSGQPGDGAQLGVLFSFYASTIVSALNAVEKVSEPIISKLLPYIHKGLKSSLADYKAASYMIVCQLVVKVVLEAELVDSLAYQVVRSVLKEPVLSREALGCLIILLQNQKDGVVGTRVFSRLCSMVSLVPTLQLMSSRHDMSPLMRQLVPHLVHSVFSASGDEPVLESLLSSVPLTKDLDQTVARLFLDQYLHQTHVSDESICSLNQRLLPLIRLFESKYHGALDNVLAGHVTNVNNDEEKRLFHEFLSLSMSTGKYKILGDTDTSLLLSLNHPQPSIRVLALEHLMGVAINMSSAQGLDESFIQDSVVERLKDDAPVVVAAALKVLEMLLDVLDPEYTTSCLLSLLHRIDLSTSEQWLPVLMEAVRLLCDPRLGKGDVDWDQRTGWKLIPFLVVWGSTRDSAQVRLSSCVARTPILKCHPLTVNWSTELDKVMKKTSDPDLAVMVNQHLLSTLTQNLENMETFSRLDALEHLTQWAEHLQGSGLRDQLSFLVLVQVLLGGLEQLTGTKHLLMSQKVFGLLEAHLVFSGDLDQQEAARLPCGPASFSEALGIYLSRCGSGERLELEFRGVLMATLREFINILKCHDTAFRGETWWNPEKLDANTCCYLNLLCRLFSVLVGGAGEGPACASYRDLMKVLVQVHLLEPPVLFRFLCLLWGYGNNHGDQLEVKVDVVLQIQALYATRALMAAQNATQLKVLADAHSPVFPSLLVCLSSPVRDIRGIGLSILHTLSAADASPYQPITERLLKNQEEIMADPSYLNTALAVLHQDTLASTSQMQKKKRLDTALRQLLEVISSPNCPSYTAASLLSAMSHVNGTDVLSALLPILDRLQDQAGPDIPALLVDEARLMQLLLGKFSEEAAPLLAMDHKCLELFTTALKSPTPTHPTLPSPQILALEQISQSFFFSIGDECVQQKLLSLMFDLAAENKSPQVNSSLSRVFKGISVDAQLVANELAPPDKTAVGGTVQQSRRNRMTSRKKVDGAEAEPEGGVSWGRVCRILELLQHKKKLKAAQTLVPVLFSLLSRCLECSPADQTSGEYTKQLLLGCLLNICTRLDPQVLEEDRFSVELVVQCIRTSHIPQTHHQALLLLGTAAAIFPDKVLLNIMPIFTFMGANIMRLDDAYSFRVIDKTIQMIIPALIQAHQLPDGQISPHMVAVVTRITHVFAEALPHMPEHRRIPVLTQLVATLGPAHFLWVLMLLLFKLHATNGSDKDRDTELDKDLDVWISVCGQFEVNQQLISIVHILSFLLQLPDDKDNAPVKRTSTRTGAKKKEEPDEKIEDLIFNVETHSSKELRHFKFICVSFMAQLLGSNSFIQKVSDSTDVVDEALQQRLLEEILHYIHSVARCVEENADKPTAKFWRALLNKTYDVLDKMNALLSTDTFIAVMKGLMGNELPSARRKAMELLNNKLQQRTKWEEPQVATFLSLIDDLLRIVGRPGGQVTLTGEAEHAINRQTALYSLKLLCRSFGSAHQEAFSPVLLRAVEIAAVTEEDKNMMGSSLLCIAEVVRMLKARAIPQLPRLMPAILSVLRDRKDVLTNELHLLSAVTALQRVMETLHHFISPYLQEVTSQVCRLTCLLQSSSSSSSSSSQLSVRLSALRTTLSTSLPPRVLLPTVTKTYSSLVSDQKNQVEALMSILKAHISHMDKDQLNVHQSELTAFFLTALDFRSEHCKDDLEKAERVEGAVIDCLVAMVMKLSEVTFRPLFFKLFDWSKSEVGGADRLLTFYRLTDAIAHRLKGLFVLFAGNLVKSFADLLRRCADTSDPLFSSELGEQKTCLLLGFILDAMTKVFMYDTQRFLSTERAHTLLSPLVDQVENLVGGAERYQHRVSNQLVPCVGQFAVALADDAHWKTLNYQVLLKTRHAHAEVRFSSLLLLLELASKLKENYMVLLPETIPFLAELMEDESEQVEQQVQTLVQQMEKILGEPLNAYF